MKKVISEEQANRENWKRYDLERNVEYPKMLPDLKSLELKRIDLRHKNRNNHESKEIRLGNWYLVGYSGAWKISKAKRNYWDTGWEFFIGSHFIDLRSIDILFEIENMPTYTSCPLGRVEETKVEEDDWEDF